MPATATYGPTPAPVAGPPSALSGKPTEATIDQVNIWMRGQPWYQTYMRSIGQDPGHPTLTENQSTQVKRLAQANGVVVDEGNIELDDHGNFNPIGHKLRNTLLVLGAAAAAVAAPYALGAFGAGGGGAAAGTAGAAGGVESGVTAGLGAASLPGAGTALGAAGAGAGAATAGTAGAVLPAATYGATGAVTNFATAPAIAGTGGATYGAAAGGSGLASNLLKYGVPVAGGIVGDIIQANASGKASDAQQKYLQEALDYEKQQDALNRTIAADKVKLEAGRYADYSGNIAPYLASGTAANSQMTSLLGLPAGSAPSRARSGGAPEGNPLDFADKLSAADKAKVDAELKAANSSDDPRYWYGVNAMHGGFDATGADWNKMRISTGDGAGKGYAGVTTPTAAAPAPAVTTQPLARSVDPAAAQTVSIQAPDGSVRQVPASQKDHWLSKGGVEVAA